MKVINKTKKYLHVRLSQDEFGLLEKAIKAKADEELKKQRELEYAEWFFSNHVEVSWEDEYSSWHSEWKNIHTRKTVNPPSIYTRVYQARFRDVMTENKKKLGYKE